MKEVVRATAQTRNDGIRSVLFDRFESVGAYFSVD